MVGRGLTAIAFKKEGKISSLKVCPISKGLTPGIPMWIDNYLFDIGKDGLEATHWKAMKADKDKFDYIINTMSSKGQLKLRRIDLFNSNNNQVAVKDLYPGYTNYYCVFRVTDNIWKLAVVGSKSVKELTTVGSNNNNESFCPVILVKKDDKFQILNHI